ncbi:NAD(P)H-dependent oxidoreductase [Allobranchiibius sp. GilTou38]|uniref:NAD(P)H-dependent oxidoreductase n=1 Tax=Allobranchiibius sp. GilTou38 TaxID=2815210 RepID=UPI001AA154C5|nr:NAD(P)H-dependent oxidoreductase [Allobranchiibius sp. GilTou38]MBO1766678.1 NAD(P)H-dependent oxidoreductase [Allobranchiibius sp. GilTou38]
MTQSLRVLALVCSLRDSSSDSSSDLLARLLIEQMPDVEATVVRVADHDVKAGVEADMGEGDQWPQIRAQLIASDIVILATPTWMGQPSSIC